MVALDAFAFVFVAGLITALATGIGALPFFFRLDQRPRQRGAVGFASGIMLAASLFGLVDEGLAEGRPERSGSGCSPVWPSSVLARRR